MTTTTTPANAPAVKAKAPKTPATKPKTVKAKTISHAKHDEEKAIALVHLVPLAQINVLPQLRTVFDDQSIAELAADIQARGLMQPVLLNPQGDRYDLIAGERRIRACRHAGMLAVPALLTKATTAEAFNMQLAENVQREALNLIDTGHAIRVLFDQHGSLQAVADEVHKSKPWVSKHLAITCENFDWQAKKLLEDGITEDLELLGVVSQIAAIDYSKSCEAVAQIRAGQLTRAGARAMLKESKAKAKKPPETLPDANMVEQLARRQAEQDEANRLTEERAKERREGTGPTFLKWALGELDELLAEPAQDTDATAYLNALSQEQRDVIQAHLVAIWNDVQNKKFYEFARDFNASNSDSWTNYIEQMATIAGLMRTPIDNLYAFVTVIEAANRPI